MKKYRFPTFRMVWSFAGDLRFLSNILRQRRQLSTAMGRRLTNWGIPFVYVEGEEESPEKKKEVEVLPDELKNQLMLKFSNVINNPIMKKLFVTVYQYRLQKSR